MARKWVFAVCAVAMLLIPLEPTVRRHNPYLRVGGAFERACRIAPPLHEFLWPPFT